MDGKKLSLLPAILVITFVLTSDGAYADAPRYIEVTSITMELDGADATFIVHYKLDLVARLYVLLLGSGNIEPAIQDLFNDFDTIQITKIREDYAVVRAKNISYKNPAQGENLYFHDSHKLGTTVRSLTVAFPTGMQKKFLDVSATPNIFFET